MEETNPQKALAIARGIVAAMKFGAISYDEAKEKCQYYFDIADKKGKEISKKHGKKYTPINFTKFAR